MDIKEAHNNNLNDETKHWWIQTRFRYIDRTIQKLPDHDSTINVIEFGTGTGQNLWYLRNQSRHQKKIQQLVGIDPELKNFSPPQWMGQNDQMLTSPKEDEREFDTLLAMDVIEHIDNDHKALSDWLPYLKKNGLVLITVPAFQSLWSNHDEFLGHKRRYTKSQLLELTKKLGLQPVQIGYIFSFALPLVYLVRKLQKRSDRPQSDLKLPHPLVNIVMKVLGRIESIFGGHPWFGTSVYGIFRKV